MTVPLPDVASMPAPLALMRVAVLCGGSSAERTVSLESGRSVMEALQSRGHRAEVVDPRDTNVRHIDWTRFDAAFLAVHGTHGEDGSLQQLLEGIGIPFTGSDSRTSRLAFNKDQAKVFFAKHGLQTPAWRIVREQHDADLVRQRTEAIGYPLVVKPVAQGSSLGVSIVERPDQLPDALGRCFHFGPIALIERAVPGTEWTVAVIDQDPLPPIRIDTRHHFYDYGAKYEDDETRFECDHPPEVTRDMTSAALKATRLLGTRGAVRADFRLDHLGRPWLLEVNTIPGLTDHSLLPRAARHAGISFPDLCERMLACCCVTASARQAG